MQSGVVYSLNNDSTMSFLLQTKPYDAKKSCWVPDEKEGFVLGEIRNATGDQVTVAFGNKVKTMVETSDTDLDLKASFTSSYIYGTLLTGTY